jgi:hypothetical protein
MPVLCSRRSIPADACSCRRDIHLRQMRPYSTSSGQELRLPVLQVSRAEPSHKLTREDSNLTESEFSYGATGHGGRSMWPRASLSVVASCFPRVFMHRDGQHSGEIQPASDELDEAQLSVLEASVDKLVRFGELVGVTPEEMIRLLDSGFTVGELLNYMASRRSLPSKCPPTGK